MSKSYPLNPQNVGFPFVFSWSGSDQEVDPKPARKILRVRGAYTVREVHYLNLINLGFSTRNPIQGPKAAVEICCTALMYLISYTTIHARIRMAILVPEGYTIRRGSWKAIVPYPLEPLLHLTLTRLLL